MIVKWYINKARYLNEKMYFFEVMQLIKSEIECVMYLSQSNGVAPSEWQDQLYSLF